MSGADRYGDACINLRAIHKNHPESDMTLDQKIALAQVEATLAVAGAVALGVVTPFVGDGEDITDWARVIATGAMGGASRSRLAATPEWPEHWPPFYGDQWRDSRGDLWACIAGGKLVCLADNITPGGPQAEDANEMNGRYGPMIRVVASPEVPF